jgi:hypothetical protein
MAETNLGSQNFSTCGYVAVATWYESCFDTWRGLPSTSGTTLYYYRTASLSGVHRSGNRVRIMVSSYYGTTYVYKAQVVITYGILKY